MKKRQKRQEPQPWFGALLFIPAIYILYYAGEAFFPWRVRQPQVILLTGAASGIGKQTALRLIANGHIVYGASRQLDQMKDIVVAGGRAIGMDVTNEAQVQDGIDRVIEEQGRIDALINNAGFGIHGAIEDISMKDAREQVDINVFGFVSCIKKVLHFMRPASNGMIINISGLTERSDAPFSAWYMASKQAVETLSESLRSEVADFGVKVVIIEPGYISSEYFNEPQEKTLQRARSSVYESATMAFSERNRRGTANHAKVANLVADVVTRRSPRPHYTAGSMLFARLVFGETILNALGSVFGLFSFGRGSKSKESSSVEL